MGSGPGGLAVGDFNGDGVPDLVVANHNSHNVSVLLGRGDGTFWPAEYYAVGWTPAGLAVADLNGDGKHDIIVVNHNGGNVSVLLGKPPTPHFRLSTNTEPRAGDSHTLQINALDAANQPDNGFTGSVRLVSSDPQAVRVVEPAGRNPVASSLPLEVRADHITGVISCAVTLRSAGAQTLIVTDVRDPARNGAITVLVRPGNATRLRVSAPMQCDSGKAFRITVAAVDVYDNVDLDYLGTVRLASSDHQAVLPGDCTFVARDGGISTFDVTLKTAGDRTLTVSDTGGRSIRGSATVAVNPKP